MAIDYDTPEGQVRLLIADTDEANEVLDDFQINGFLSLNDGNVRRAAADALDAIADSETLVSKVIRTQDLNTDGSKVADSLRKHADRLRQQADSDDDTEGGWDGFDVIDSPTCLRPEHTNPEVWGL